MLLINTFCQETIRFTRSILAIFVISVQGLEAQGARETFDLKFDWPDGLVLNVERKFERVTSIGPKHETVSSEPAFSWGVVEREGEFQIKFGRFRQLNVEEPPQSKDPVILLEYVARKIEPILPTIVIESNAQPIRLDNLDAVKHIGAVMNKLLRIRFGVLKNQQSFNLNQLKNA